MDTIQVYVENCIYRNENNGYSVLDTVYDGEQLVVVGFFQGDVVGETLEISGEMIIHPSYGLQLKMSHYSIVRPSDADSIKRYLGSGAIKGIGPKTAERIIERFGDDALRIMEEEPERLAEIKGISLKKAQELGLQVEEKKTARNAIIYLQQYGMSVKMANRVIEFYGDTLFDVMTENPYRLAEDIDGIGFLTADEIAGKMGVEKTSRYRIRSGMLYALQESMLQGNTCVKTDDLVNISANLLSLEPERIKDELSEIVIAGKVVIRDDLAYLRSVYMAETFSARDLLDRNWKDEKDPDLMQRVQRAFEDQGIAGDPLQEKAVYEAASSGVFILTGGPGTGKTTTLNAMIRFFLEERKNLVLAAPTGRAAKRMTEATGYEAKTIHRLLEVKVSDEGGHGYFDRNEDNPIEADVVIVDEMSMVDIFLFQALLKAVPKEAHLIMVGDPDQLLSVGPGQVLSDILGSGLFNTVRLKTIFRQDEESRIVINAHRIKEGREPSLSDNTEDFIFLERDRTDTIQSNILTLLTKQLPAHFNISSLDIQVLTPIKKGALGTENLNRLLQKYCNPPSDDKPECVMGDKVLRMGDKVMQVKNDYEMPWYIRSKKGVTLEEGSGVFNGDVGVIENIVPRLREVTVLFDDDREVVYSFEQTEHLELAYATTIHKSQGSEYPAILLPLLNVPATMRYRNLFYTAITRAVRCVTILGDREVVKDMIRNEDTKKRYTGLRSRLVEMGGGSVKGDSQVF